MATVIGSFFALSGLFVYAFFVSLFFGLIADYIAYLAKYRQSGLLLLAYTIFSFNPIGPVLPLFLASHHYQQILTDHGKSMSYIQSVFTSLTIQSPWLLCLLLIISSILGGLFGQRMVNKHFKRAGLVP